MLKNDLILRNPLSRIEGTAKAILQPGQFGAVLARAGVGKTAFMVQLSLYSLLKEHKVLHISLNESIHKVTLWYQEVFQHLTPQYQGQQIHILWESIIQHRFIMTFKAESFNIASLEERLTDLAAQNIFAPQMILIDGFPFETSASEELRNLQELSETYSSPVWFTVRTHREDIPDTDGIPPVIQKVAGFFNCIVQLLPQKEAIHVHILKGSPGSGDSPRLYLDPATMLIKDKM